MTTDTTASDFASSPDSVPVQFSWGVTLAIVGTFLFALKSIFIKLAFAAGADATLLLAIRMVLAFPFYVVVFAVLLRRRRSHSACTGSAAFPIRIVVRSLLLGFLGYYLASYLDLSGLEYISAQLERLTLFTYPAMVAALAWMFLGEQVNAKILMAIGLSYAGVWLMYGQERSFTPDGNTGWGVFLVFGAALSYSLYVLFAKPVMQKIGSREFTSLAMIGSTFFVVIHFLCTHSIGDFFDAQPIVYVYGLVLAFVCTVIPSFMINEAILKIGATRTTVIGSVGPVLTMFLAVAVLDEPSSWKHLAGMSIAIVGVSLVAKK
ncbi:DMT family transporter [Rhodopirellula sp. P2]|uniref:DMT family transporter n=1 Tax=Rhodopirellula sp. P2 TaxID=2127060 RepID=UPI002368A0B5|nr:DMT family transporter [Rhodopirellula sp. P2]WDQ14762.1 DMT family transporter [Rhodopirellula sp. P2]